jgi:hypothetical protein
LLGPEHYARRIARTFVLGKRFYEYSRGFHTF